MVNENGYACCPECGYEFQDGELGYELHHKYVCDLCFREFLNSLKTGDLAELVGSDAKIMSGIREV